MKYALCIVAALLLSSLATAQEVFNANEELQLAIRRHMQCQADNVGTYNAQSKLFLEEKQQLIKELLRAQEELKVLREKEVTRLKEDLSNSRKEEVLKGKNSDILY